MRRNIGLVAVPPLKVHEKPHGVPLSEREPVERDVRRDGNLCRNPLLWIADGVEPRAGLLIGLGRCFPRVLALSGKWLEAYVAQVRAPRPRDSILHEAEKLRVRELVATAVFPFAGSARRPRLHQTVRITGIRMAVRRTGRADERIDPTG